MGPLPCYPFNFNKHNLVRQGTGTADHLTLLQLLFNIISLSNAQTEAIVVSDDKDSNNASFETNLTSEIESIQKKTQSNEKLY